MINLSVLSSSSSFTCRWTFDVFLSFRGEDTSLYFTDNLYNSLHQKGIHTFIDDVGLRRGEEITPAFLNAIEQSRIAVIVFSKNYASSTFCLDELVKILELVKREGRLVLPIFYDVDPSEVRCQTGSYGEAMSTHQTKLKNEIEKVEKWKLALQEVASLTGWHFKPGLEYEYQFIGRIVEEVYTSINRSPLHTACNNSSRLQFDDHKDLERDEVKMVMAKLGLFLSTESLELEKRYGSREFSSLFEEEEPSLDELKQAFDMFDENKDGFIDARELQRVLCILGSKEARELEKCKEMIANFDENGNGRLDLNEFVKIMVMSLDERPAYPKMTKVDHHKRISLWQMSKALSFSFFLSLPIIFYLVFYFSFAILVYFYLRIMIP